MPSRLQVAHQNPAQGVSLLWLLLLSSLFPCSYQSALHLEGSARPLLSNSPLSMSNSPPLLSSAIRRPH